MKMIWSLLAIVLCCGACDNGSGVHFVRPSGGLSANNSVNHVNNHVVVARYTATLTASPTCTDALPAEARERAYQLELFEGGALSWASPTLNPPPGHRLISSGTMDGVMFSFSIGTARDWDPQDQSDAFNGLTDTLNRTGVLTIAGKGAGTVGPAGITGTLTGLFAYYEGTQATYCWAADHRFTLATQ
jgi:hypothetical protein